MKQQDGWMVCRKCEYTLPESDFPPNKRKKSGLSSWCRRCHVEATREWRERKRDEKLEAQHEWARLHWERTHRETEEWKHKTRARREQLRDTWEGVVPE